MKEFEGKVAIVTGTTGIGRAIAKRFATDGANVLACGIEVAANRELTLDAKANGLSLQVEQCDVTQAQAVREVVAKAVREFGGLDVIVNSAAFHPFGTVVETGLEDWNRCLMVNVGSIYLLGHFGIPEMKKRGGGSIINLASVQGHACQRGVAAYAASKGAVHSLTRALALDHAGDNIRVNSISPGSIRTPMLERSAGHFSPGAPDRRSLQAVRGRSSAGANRHTGRGGRAGCVSRVGQICVLHRRRLPGGWRAAGWHRSAVTSLAITSQPVCVAPTGDVCGEGAVWHAAHSAVYWTDINRFLIHRFTLADQCVRTWFFDEPVTALILTDRDDVLAVVLGSGVILWEPASDLRHKPIFHLEGWPAVRLNDGRADPRGSLWVGSMRNNVNPDGSSGEAGGKDGILHRLDPDAASTIHRRGVGISNTLAWSPDRRRFYFGDTLANVIWSYDYDAAHRHDLE